MITKEDRQLEIYTYVPSPTKPGDFKSVLCGVVFLFSFMPVLTIKLTLMVRCCVVDVGIHSKSITEYYMPSTGQEVKIY